MNRFVFSFTPLSLYFLTSFKLNGAWSTKERLKVLGKSNKKNISAIILSLYEPSSIKCIPCVKTQAKFFIPFTNLYNCVCFLMPLKNLKFFKKIFLLGCFKLLEIYKEGLMVWHKTLKRTIAKFSF